MSSDTSWSDLADVLFPSDIWTPILDILSPGITLASTIFFLSAVAYGVILYTNTTKDIPGAWNPWVIFWLFVTLGILFLIIAWALSPIKFFGLEILSSAPNSCVGNKGSLEGGLCYNNCRDGYHGFGVRCYADTVDIGPGTVVGLKPCPDGWNTSFLTCAEPISCKSLDDCIHGRGCGCTGGRVIGRLDDGGTCPGPQDFGDGMIRVDSTWDNYYKTWERSHSKGDPTVGPDGELETLEEANAQHHKTCGDVAEDSKGVHTEKIDGLCYKPCPSGMQHVPGMPYLCFKGGELSYDRGGGSIPPAFRFLGKYAVNVPPHAPVDNTPT